MEVNGSEQTDPKPYSNTTIHFFSNEKMTKNIHDGDEPIKIHYGGKSWNQYAAGELYDKLKHLPLPHWDSLQSTTKQLWTPTLKINSTCTTRTEHI